MTDSKTIRRQLDAITANARTTIAAEVADLDGSAPLYSALLAAQAETERTAAAIRADNEANANLYAPHVSVSGVVSVATDAQGLPSRALGADLADFERALIHRHELIAADRAATNALDRAAKAYRERPQYVDPEAGSARMDEHLTSLVDAAAPLIYESEAVAAFARAAGHGAQVAHVNPIASAIVALIESVEASIAQLASDRAEAEQRRAHASVQGLRLGSFVPDHVAREFHTAQAETYVTTTVDDEKRRASASTRTARTASKEGN